MKNRKLGEKIRIYRNFWSKKWKKRTLIKLLMRMNWKNMSLRIGLIIYMSFILMWLYVLLCLKIFRRQLSTWFSYKKYYLNKIRINKLKFLYKFLMMKMKIILLLLIIVYIIFFVLNYLFFFFFLIHSRWIGNEKIE